MKIMINDKYVRLYKQKCFDNIKNKYPTRDEPYTDKEKIKTTCKTCINLLVLEFEKECNNIITLGDLYYFIGNYSIIYNEQDKDSIIAKKLCKYLFGEITKHKLVESMDINITDDLFSRLFYITKGIDEYIQLYFDNIWNKSKILQLEVYDNDFYITLIDEKSFNNHKELIEKLSTETFNTSFDDSNEIERYKNIIIEAFGEIAIHFIDAIFPLTGESNNSAIIDISSIVKKYPDSMFLKGLILSQNNNDLRQAIFKPNDINLRTRYRPILEINVDGNLKYYTTEMMVYEAISEHISNQIPFGELPKEWKLNITMSQYAKEQKEKHGKRLEDKMEKFIKKDYTYKRNIKCINNINLEKEESNIEGRFVGEIDFIIINVKQKSIFVVDCKYLKLKQIFSLFLQDKDKFEKDKGYNDKLSYKINWVENHLSDVAKDFKIKDLSSFNIKGFFVTDSFTYYSLESKYPIIPIKKLTRFLNRENKEE